MKKGTIIILAIVALLVIWGVASYNRLVRSEEAVNTAWSQVENQYQRRADLIPNLVNTVKGYTGHESQTLLAVTEARARATQVTVDPANLTPEALAEYQRAQGDVTTALNRLLMVREAYPDLKANQNFLELQAQLEGTENRISVERKRFNEAAREYNVSIRRFPASLIAGVFGFTSKPYFEAEEGSDRAPQVSF